ncbi:MAG: TIGR02646 family protein [Candidatus Cloacimonetes bacterium]|nr:TIGR02646 family protein [Candidatus Cloacimonadota bacterium]
MRYIKKGAEPQELINHKALANDNWKPTYCNLDKDVKRAICDSLLNEQYHICCYCESELRDDDYHIEHVMPRHLENVCDLDYSNLACSCIGQTKRRMPIHCGHAKNDSIINVTPFNTDCEAKFVYVADGTIVAKDGDEDAKRTIEVLKLNIPKLKDLRSETIAIYIEILESDNNIKTIMEEDMKPMNGKLPPFVSMIRYFYNTGYLF